MGARVTIDVTVRRKDRGKITKHDLEQFIDYWEENVDDRRFTDGPYHMENQFAHNYESIFAHDEQLSWHFDAKESLTPYAKEHPEMQIEVFYRCEDGEDTCIRFLFEGDIVEELQEVKYFEKPQHIKWEVGE